MTPGDQSPFLDDTRYPAKRLDIGERVAADGNHVGIFAGRDGADVTLVPQATGRIDGRRADRAERGAAITVTAPQMTQMTQKRPQI